MRVLVETLHLLAGIAVTLVIAELAAWGYPPARHDFWLVAWAAIVASVLISARPIWRAWRIDRGRMRAPRTGGGVRG